MGDWFSDEMGGSREFDGGICRRGRLKAGVAMDEKIGGGGVVGG